MDHPHPTYLLMLGIGKYDILESKSSSGVPLKLYYYPEWKNRVDLTYKYMGKIFDFPYAYSKYKEVRAEELERLEAVKLEQEKERLRKEEEARLAKIALLEAEQKEVKRLEELAKQEAEKLRLQEVAKKDAEEKLKLDEIARQ